MTPSDAFDPVEFKQTIRTEWRSAAAGWRTWLHVVEAAEGGQRHSARLVELAELAPGTLKRLRGFLKSGGRLAASR